MHLTQGETLKMNLYIDHSNVTIVYRPKSDNVDRVIVQQGVVVEPLDPLLEARLIVEGSELIMKDVQVADMGVFKVNDLAGFPVAHVYIEVNGKLDLQEKLMLFMSSDDFIFFPSSEKRKISTEQCSLDCLFVSCLPSADKMPPLGVVILSMLGLIASMLLVCLLSCLYKVHKRNEKNKKLTLLAQQAAKGDGDTFREVKLTLTALCNFYLVI